jgi:hypothetical protein
MVGTEEVRTVTQTLRVGENGGSPGERKNENGIRTNRDESLHPHACTELETIPPLELNSPQ